MIDAPRDGSVILALYNDASGVEAIRWGMYRDDDTKEGWFQADWNDEALEDDNYRGWVKAPLTKEWNSEPNN